MCIWNSKIFIVFITSVFFDFIVAENDYLVDNEKCRIPNIAPFNREVLPLWVPQPYLPCTNRSLLTFIEKNEQEAILHVKKHLLPLYGTNIKCCISEVHREEHLDFPDDRIRLTPCRDFEENITLTAETIVVRCRNNFGYQVYSNAHSVVLKTSKVKQKLAENSFKKRPLSVLFIVIDSVSRLNLIRTMPKTRDYLLENDFIEMKGYSKIDDNTFPNFLAFLNGLNKTQTNSIKCTGREVNELDLCPMLWYDFSKKGYITAYGEDWGPLGTFNFNKKGFKNSPTDFYFRPYVLASEYLGTLSLNSAPYCAGPETSGERQLNLALDFSKTFKGDPYFGVFWMNTFSHQALNTPLRFDDTMLNFFTNLKAEGVFNDSLVIFLSDHGIRMETSIRKTLAGWFEERLPMNLISVPHWFKKEFPQKFENLKENSLKLTTTYDLYMLLQEILESSSNYEMKPSKACAKCASMFRKLPERTCTEAGVPQEWCTCLGKLVPINARSELVTQAANYLVNHINSELVSLNLTSICCKFSISHVYSAGLSEFNEAGKGKILFVNFLTMPYADFIASLSYDSEKDKPFNLLFDVIRLDRWYHRRCGQHSYCYCKNEIDSISDDSDVCT